MLLEFCKQTLSSHWLHLQPMPLPTLVPRKTLGHFGWGKKERIHGQTSAFPSYDRPDRHENKTKQQKQTITKTIIT